MTDSRLSFASGIGTLEEDDPASMFTSPSAS